jgi:hypothetical protein
MRQLILIILLLIIYSCQTSIKTNPANKGSKTLYDDKKDYETLIFTKYNADNLVIEDKVFSPHSRGIYLDTIVATTQYFYDNNKNLKEKLRINETFRDTTKTIYIYNDNNKLILEIEVEHLKDTVLIVKNDYFEEDGFTIIKKLKLEKDRFSRDNNNEIPFDTTITLTKEKYSDSLIIKEINYSVNNGNAEFNDSINYKYNSNGNLVKWFTIDKNGDITSWKDIEYRDEKKVKDNLYIDKGNHLISEIYDSLGFIDKILNFNYITGEIDTVQLKCDKNGNVIFMKGK